MLKNLVRSPAGVLLALATLAALASLASAQCGGCRECSKSWDPYYDDCGNPCPDRECDADERCSASAGYVCIYDPECATNCPSGCLDDGEEQPSNGCGGLCDLPSCGSCTPVCPGCSKSWDPIDDGCGGTCPSNNCASDERCSSSAGLVCVSDPECADNCPSGCLEDGEEQPSNGCGGSCNLRACSDTCVPDCPQCTKSWDPVDDGCGHLCPSNNCDADERCSYSEGYVCVDDDDCADACSGCRPSGSPQPSNGCGGTCDLPTCDSCTPECPSCVKSWEDPVPDGCGGVCEGECPSDYRCSASAGYVCVYDPDETCVPDCPQCTKSGLSPIYDGCGGVCGGDCPSGYRCSESSGLVCVVDNRDDSGSCVPSCPQCVKDGQDYGDGCGGTCQGDCPSGYRCSASSGQICVVSNSASSVSVDPDAWTGGIMVPAYWPLWREDGQRAYADAVELARSLDPGRMIAVVNPASGPGSSSNKYLDEYTDFCRAVRQAGQRCLGYIYTDYTDRPLAEVYADMRRYREYFEGEIDGYLLDEALTQNGHYNYYEDTADECFDVLRNLDFYSDTASQDREPYCIVFNPGAVNEQTGPFAHLGANTVIYETTAAKFLRRTPDDGSRAWQWMAIGAPVLEKTSVMVHTADSWRAIRDRTAAVGIRWYYATDEPFDPNPWYYTPSYMADMYNDAISTNTIRSDSPVDFDDAPDFEF